MCERNDVGGSAAAVAHHHRHGRFLAQTLQHDGDDVRTPLHDQTHHRYALT